MILIFFFAKGYVRRYVLQHASRTLTDKLQVGLSCNSLIIAIIEIDKRK
jgi:hypothetical protein